MKKILSVMLAIMMVLGSLGISVAAVPATTQTVSFGSTIVNTTLDATKHVIVVLDFNGGSSLDGLNVYDTEKGAFVYTYDVSGRHLMLPGCGYEMVPGARIYLPRVGAPDGLACQGWEIVGTGSVVGHGIDWYIPSGSQGQIIELVARYTTAQAEEDTLGMVLGVLKKVFGTIIGILFLDGNSTAGVELMEKLLGGLL